MTRFCVFYVVRGRERRSRRFYSRERACRALEILRRRHGERSAVLYRG